MISLLIPIYNTKIEFLEECFSSIDTQTFTNYEVIIVNDGSNEETSNFLYNLEKPKYSVYHIEKQGISQALNYGIDRCNFQIIARMDGDDVMLPNRLQLQYEYIIHKEIDILGAQMEIFGYKTGITEHPSMIDKDIIFKTHWFINHPTVMFKKDIIKKIGGYNSNFDGVEDIELWYRAFYNNLRMENLKELLLRHRKHSDNATNKKGTEYTLEKINKIKEYYLPKI